MARDPLARDPQRDLAPFTEEQLDDLAEITPEDLERAQRAFRRDAAGTGFARLLDASPEPEEDEDDGG